MGKTTDTVMGKNPNKRTGGTKSIPSVSLPMDVDMPMDTGQRATMGKTTDTVMGKNPNKTTGGTKSMPFVSLPMDVDMPMDTGQRATMGKTTDTVMGKNPNKRTGGAKSMPSVSLPMDVDMPMDTGQRATMDKTTDTVMGKNPNKTTGGTKSMPSVSLPMDVDMDSFDVDAGAMDDIAVAKLTRNQAKSVLAHLAAAIAAHDQSYYVKDDPTISDDAYDRLRRRNDAIEARFPDLIRPDSPSLRLGALPAKGFDKVLHEAPMLSLDNGFDADDITAFYQRVRRFLQCRSDALPCFVEAKIDGLSVSLLYQNGRLVRAATRGDGRQGEDISANFRFVSGAPTTIPYKENIEIRGEVYMKISDFQVLNADQAKRNQALFSNPRNAAAGSLRQLDPTVTARRKLIFTAYSFAGSIPADVQSQSDWIACLRKWGFCVDSMSRLCVHPEEVEAFYHELGDSRDSLDHMIDGVVVKIDDFARQRRLGHASRAPRWAIAWKFAPAQAITTIRDIDVQVGRTGVLTPVAVLEPVLIGSVLIRRASLHNEDEVGRLGVAIGDKVVIERAGDVIPKVIRRVAGWTMPKHCPQCGSVAVRADGEVHRRCSGTLVCPAQARAGICHFVSRHAFDIEGLGTRTIDQFWELGWLTNPVDIFFLHDHAQAMKELEGWGEKSVENLLGAIDRRRRLPLARFIYALGIPGIGESLAEEMARFFRSLSAWLKAVEQAEDNDGAVSEELLAIDGIGHSAISAMIAFVKGEKTGEILRKLSHIVDTFTKVTQDQSLPLSGKTILFTGTLASMSRREAKSTAKSLGARVAVGVSRKVDMVVIGDKPGSKATKARDLGLEILDEGAWGDLMARHRAESPPPSSME